MTNSTQCNMKEITEDYVSFETAKLLKEKGFDEDITRVVNEEGEIDYLGSFQPSSAYLYHTWYRCPTLQMAMKWLREVHRLTIDVFHFRDWKVNIKTIPDDYFKADYSYHELKPAETYEQACEAAIKYCLENLI